VESTSINRGGAKRKGRFSEEQIIHALKEHEAAQAWLHDYNHHRLHTALGETPSGGVRGCLG